MAQAEEGIGDRYHQETRYRRYSMQGGRLDWAHQPSPYKEFPHPLKRFPIQPPVQKGGKPLWETIGERRSLREFSGHPITFSDLSQLHLGHPGDHIQMDLGMISEPVLQQEPSIPSRPMLPANRVEGMFARNLSLSRQEGGTGPHEGRKFWPGSEPCRPGPRDARRGGSRLHLDSGH